MSRVERQEKEQAMKLAGYFRSENSGSSRRGRLGIMAIMVVVLAAAVAVPALARNDDAGISKQLAPVKQATTKYHDVNVAVADGYQPIKIKGDLCVTDGHHGAMGIHYLNGALVDDTLDPLKPELLLYEERGGKLHLIGVEYFTPDTGQAHPSLFGRQLDGPNSNLEPEIPRHYSLHAWIWKANPDGMFTPYNPNVRC
jgi:hypothetical protein